MVAGMSAVVVLLLCGCATYQPGSVTCGEAGPLPEPLRRQLGTIAVVSPGKPAEVSFDRAAGQIETFGDRASVAAARMLDPSGISGDPAGRALAGAVGFAAAPVAAVAAGLSAARERLSPSQLSECESNLLRAMKTMAAQERFQGTLVKAANEKTRRRLIVVELVETATGAHDSNRASGAASLPETHDANPAPRALGGYPGAESVLETQVQQLRLERTGKGDSSYALIIKAKARLLRASDGAVLYERPVEYRSGTCLFLDWTLSDSFQRVAETGYREMAERLVDRLFVATPEGPLLAGAGYRKSPGHQNNDGVELAANRGSVRQPAAQFVNYPAANTGSISISSGPEFSGFTFQKPLTKDEAAAEAPRDVAWALDGLYNHPNPMISLPSLAVAIPVGLWKQGVAVVRGLTEREFRQADASLAAAARETRPQEDLAVQVAQQLAPQTSQAVVLVNKPLTPGAEEESAVMQRVARGTPAWLPRGRTAASYLVGQGAETALEIHVVSASLSAKDGVNPPMALCVEAEARLLRARDGQEIYSCPIRYRSQERKFTQWAAQNAQLFRQELQSCYRELGKGIVEQLVSRRLVEPDRVAYATLTKN
ncbi:MAG: hypothetical protein ABSF95_17580 [Verrucomicrobiota bacterium]